MYYLHKINVGFSFHPINIDWTSSIATIIFSDRHFSRDNKYYVMFAYIIFQTERNTLIPHSLLPMVLTLTINKHGAKLIFFSGEVSGLFITHTNQQSKINIRIYQYPLSKNWNGRIPVRLIIFAMNTGHHQPGSN